MPRASDVENLSPPTIRLATGVGPPDAFAKGMSAPTGRLAHKVNQQGDRTLEEGPPSVRLAAAGALCFSNSPDTYAAKKAILDPGTMPALLVSFYYLKPFLENKHRYYYRDWVLDSGAFSAHASGVKIDLQEYIDVCRRLLTEDQTLVEVYALDVIGDWRASLKNTEEMWRQGVPAIPCFHANEPWDALLGTARDYPKIALGGVALAKSKKKMGWAAQCFARVWPKRIHGFAFGSEKAIMTLPFHSVDATNWEIGPCKYGRWASFNNAQISVRGSQQNLRSEVEWYLELEARARQRWKKEMIALEDRSELVPNIRLALGGEGDSGGSQRAEQISKATNPAGSAAPTVRLAHKESGRPNKGLSHE